MNVKRLTILRDALIAYAKNPGNLQFDLGAWLKYASKYEATEADMVARRAKNGDNYCGTTACACGLAAAIPEFKRNGLRLVFNVQDEGSSYAILAYKDAIEFDAASLFFELDHHEDAFQLFSPCYYGEREKRDPLAVADRITALLHTA